MVMNSDRIPELFFLVYPLIVIIFRRIIRLSIPRKTIRKQFLRDYDYLKKLLYLFLPLIVFHFELVLLRAGYPFYEINFVVIVILVVLQSCIFFTAIINFLQFFGELKRFRKYLKRI
jgi:hypothetical protein